MKEKTTYIANDGTEFEIKEKCEHYENRYKALLDNPEFIFFNKSLEPLAKYNIMGDHSWHNLFACSYYINIPSVECFDLLEEAYDEFLVDRFTDFDITIDDDVSINEVYDNYDIIDKQGEIWTLKEKNR